MKIQYASCTPYSTEWLNSSQSMISDKGEMIMSINRRLRESILTIATIPQRVIRYIASAVTRIFGPTDDNYPATGVQPFEGEPADEKSLGE